MKKIISTLLISVSAFTTVSSASCSAVWPFTKKSATVSTTVAKEKAAEINLKELEIKIQALSNEEKAKLRKAFGIKENIDSPSFLTKCASVIGATIGVAAKGFAFFCFLGAIGIICNIYQRVDSIDSEIKYASYLVQNPIFDGRITTLQESMLGG